MSDYETCLYWLKVANRKKSSKLRSKVFALMNKARHNKRVF